MYRTDGKWMQGNNIPKDSMGSRYLVIGAGLATPRLLMDVCALTLTFENLDVGEINEMRDG
jgi:hypothetical protein